MRNAICVFSICISINDCRQTEFSIKCRYGVLHANETFSWNVAHWHLSCSTAFSHLSVIRKINQQIEMLDSIDYSVQIFVIICKEATTTSTMVGLESKIDKTKCIHARLIRLKIYRKWRAPFNGLLGNHWANGIFHFSPPTNISLTMMHPGWFLHFFLFCCNPHLCLHTVSSKRQFLYSFNTFRCFCFFVVRCCVNGTNFKFKFGQCLHL